MNPCPKCQSQNIGSWGWRDIDCKRMQLAECNDCGHLYAYEIPCDPDLWPCPCEEGSENEQVSD
jgi:hypothetical protein